MNLYMNQVDTLRSTHPTLAHIRCTTLLSNSIIDCTLSVSTANVGQRIKKTVSSDNAFIRCLTFVVLLYSVIRSLIVHHP